MDTEGIAVNLQAGPIIDAAINVLRPNQAGNQTVESFYRREAWHVIQVCLDVWGVAGEEVGEGGYIFM